MRTQRLILVFLFLAVSSGIAQTPNDGKVVGNSYVNSYLKFSYSWPAMLRLNDISSLNLPKSSPYGNEFLLFSARQGDEPYGIIVLAEKLNVVTPHSTGWHDSADFFNALVHFKPEQHAVILSRKHFTNSAGLIFDQLDYTENGTPTSAIVIRIGEFLIVFRCNAKSAADLAEMDKSAAALQLIK